MKKCIICGDKLSRYESKYCSNKCQSRDRYLKYIREWKSGKKSGMRGVNTINISYHVRRYLSEKYGEKCCLCGWCKINPITKKVPLEVDHIDGDAENNREENLRLVCPNCHSLSPNFRNLNKGSGRSRRRAKEE